MRKSKERRKQKTPKPPDKTFRYPVICIKCHKGFLVAEEGLDLSNLACDICSGKLRYRKGKGVGKETDIKIKHKKKMKGEETDIKKLLKQLRETKDPEEGKRLRRLLRRRGHHGGLHLKGKKK